MTRKVARAICAFSCGVGSVYALLLPEYSTPWLLVAMWSMGAWMCLLLYEVMVQR